MDKPPVYVETSIISYLAARPGNDPITRLRQEATREWWNVQRCNQRLMISDAVVAEIESFDVTPGMLETANRLIARSLIFDPEDAVHVAASVRKIDYLLTWNFKHINNPATKMRIAVFLESLGLVCPRLCTPIDMLQGKRHG